MPLPVLGGFLGLGAGLYGLNALATKIRGNLLDKAIGSEGWEQSGPFRPEEQTMGMMGEVRNPQIGARGLLADPYNPIEQTKASAMLAANPMFRQRTIDSIINPLMAEDETTTLQRQFEYYQGLPQNQQQQLLDYRRSGAANIDLGQGGVGVPYTAEQKATAGFNPQSVVIPDKNGIPRVISKEQFTQPQILSGGFATRMATASGEIADLKASGIDPAGIVQNLDMFGVPDVMVNFMRSPEGQRYRQAQENWITANLRKESGAAIPEEETEREIKKWFPQPGDSPDVIAQKERARRDAELSMIKSSGGAFQDLQDQADMEELQRLRMEQQ